MPAWTALGVKSSISVAARVGAVVVEPPEPPEPQPAATTARSHATITLASIGPGRISRARIGQHLAFVEWTARMRRRVTFSRNLTLSLSRTCRCYCKYCTFATHKPHLYSPDEVLEIL